MIGRVRPLARYARPRSATKVVGECFFDMIVSLPRGETAPPITVTEGDTALSASYVCASIASYAGAPASRPSLVYCGIQKRLRFGSLPMMKRRTVGSAVASDA